MIGDLTDLPHQRSSAIRIFLSSTFSGKLAASDHPMIIAHRNHISHRLTKNVTEIILVTFMFNTDYKEERNALVRSAYPELKAYCSSLGLDFQVIDLRWGIPDDTAIDHRMEKICLKEIENCQRLSRGPNFVVS